VDLLLYILLHIMEMQVILKLPVLILLLSLLTPLGIWLSLSLSNISLSHPLNSTSGIKISLGCLFPFQYTMIPFKSFGLLLDLILKIGYHFVRTKLRFKIKIIHKYSLYLSPSNHLNKNF